MNCLSMRWRLVVTCAVAMAVLFCVTGILFFTQLQSELQSSTDRSLRVQADSLISGVLVGNVSFGDSTSPGIVGGLPFSQLVTASGKVLESSEALGQRPLLAPSVLKQLLAATYVTGSIQGIKSPVRLLAVPFKSAGKRVIVVTGRALARQDQVLSSFLKVLIVGGLLAVLAAGAAGWLLASAALRPVERMRREAATITASDQDRRLAVPRTNDEISRLSKTLNDMLSRLHAAFRREQRFVDDASHELRTPLALLKAELELGIARPRSSHDLAGVIERSLGATNELIALAQDLLVLARSDATRLPLDRHDGRVDRTIESVVAGFAQRAKDANIVLNIAATPEEANFDEVRIRQALNNLLDNALWHTPVGGIIFIRADRFKGALRIVVRDTGSGVEPEVAESAFEPFVRGPLRRATMAPGAGLGLTIVRSIAESHGGTATLDNVDGGAQVTLLLPAD
jgi:signal transduction histidine kinase